MEIKAGVTRKLETYEKRTLVVSAGNKYLFPSHIIQKENLTIINFHNVLLPHFPGRNEPSWAIWAGAEESGATWHLVSEGVDEGDCLWQKACAVTEDMRAYELSKKIMEMAFEGFQKIFEDVILKKAAAIPQDVRGASQETDRLHYSWEVPGNGVFCLQDKGRFVLAKLSISNIAWQADEDTVVYEWMKKYGYDGLEIAPTRIFPEAPYERLEEAGNWAAALQEQHGFVVPSMQSIWFGRQEKLFGTAEERQILLEYTKKAVDFAEAVGCRNLVFGCPRNRAVPEGATADGAVSFFREAGEYAAAHGTVIGMEANPPIYHTNYINDTLSALRLIEEVASKGFLLNLDVGTMIWNKEDVEELTGKVHLINHVHISEPNLAPVVAGDFHQRLRRLLEAEAYQGYISIEMGRAAEISRVEEALQSIREAFA